MDDMIREFIKAKKATMLCSGPMSKNCIDAAIELSNELRIPQILIASRRQIDSSEFGGGYVENFDTHSFANYVRSKKSDNIFKKSVIIGPTDPSVVKVKDYYRKLVYIKNANYDILLDIQKKIEESLVSYRNVGAVYDFN